jgi:protein gp37
MNKTNIEYLDYTWNPISMRCFPISPGCANCWHLAVADRLAKNPKISIVKRRAYSGKSRYFLDRRELEAPLKRKKPSIIGVQFMGDLFHSKISYETFERIMMVITDAPQHTFIMLTKRPRQMLQFIKNFNGLLAPAGPLKNLWLGVTCENQETLEERRPILLKMPAAKRLLSVEPMLSDIDIRPRHFQADGGWLDWVICGCESGPKRRKTEIDWIANLRDQCFALGLPFFLKQMEVSGKIVKMPQFKGKVWAQYPK